MSAARGNRSNEAAGRPIPLTHAEAEALISARLDGPLDPVANRALNAHLAGCPSCRAFAARVDVMARGLRSLPHLPPSPTVSRQVRERVERGQSSWTRVLAWLGAGRMGLAPAAAAAMVLLAALAFVVVTQFNNDGNTPSFGAPSHTVNEHPTATSTPRTGAFVGSPTREPTTPTAQPTVTPTAMPNVVVTPPAPTPTPTATNAPQAPTVAAAVIATTRPTATAAPAATATTVPTATATATEVATATATAEPTETPTPQPTETPKPEPTMTATATATAEPPTATATARPTETATPVPTEPPATATSAPTATATATATAAATATATATPEPTATMAPTSTPTPEPTATPEPTETSTPAPTETSTPKPTRTPTPEPTATATATVGPTTTPTQPPIQPRDGQPVEAAGSNGTEAPTEEPTTAPTAEEQAEPTAQPTTEENPTIEVRGGAEETATPTSIPTPTSTPTPPSATEAAPTVAPVEEETPTVEPTAEKTAEPTANAVDVADAEQVTSVNVTGAPAGPLLLAPNGTGFVFTGSSGVAVSNMNGGVDVLGPADALIWSPGGNYVLYANTPNGQSAIATLNWNTDEILQITSGTDGVDVPAGWLGDRIYYLRTLPDQPGVAELHSANPDGSDDAVVWTGENVTPVGQRPVAAAGGMLIPTQSSWLLVTPSGDVSTMGANHYGTVTAPTLSPGGSLIAYLAGDQVIVASVNSPGVAIASIPSAGSFDWSPDGEQLVVTDGSGVTIYTNGGAPVMSIPNSTGVGIAAVGWTGDGIYLLESNPVTGLFLLPTSALNG